MNYDLSKNQHLVPTGVQSLLNDPRQEALLSNDHSCEGVRQPAVIWTNETTGLVHVRSQLEGVRFYVWKIKTMLFLRLQI